MPDATVVLSLGTAVITTLASGQPVTPLVVVEGQPFSAFTMDYTSSLNGSGGRSRVPFDAVNSLKTGLRILTWVRAWRARSHSVNESKEPSVLEPSTC